MRSGWLLIRLWIIAQVILAAGAWILSAFKLLDLRGYCVVAVAWLFWSWAEYKRWEIGASDLVRDIRKLGRRFKRPLPLTILAIGAISLIGGAIWPSTYVDTLAYRLPRALHWISEKSWHWIPSDDTRVNVVGLNLELTWVPILLLFKSDRPLFLLNLISYALLPGLFFSFLRQTGVARRTAWHWMWILPAGYVFAMQAASLGSDAHSAIVALAAVTLALRSRQSNDIWDLWYSILAAGFLTGIKQVAVPLGLVWLPAILPSARRLLTRPVASGVILVVATLVSFVPLTVFNTLHTGSWKGFSKEDLATWEQDSALWGIVGGVFSVTAQNLAPPVFPLAGRWNALMAEFVTTEIGRNFKYDLGPALLQQAVAEHTAPLGLGIVFLTALTLFAARRREDATDVGARVDWSIRAVRWLPFVAVLVFLAKSSVSFNGRYIAPYYPFFFPLLLCGQGVARLTSRMWWRRIAVAVNVIAIGALLFSRHRPLWPVHSVADWVNKRRPHDVRARKVLEAFTIIHNTRAHTFPGIQAALPLNERVVGYAVGRQPYLELPLWLPLGSRKVFRVNAADTADTVRQKGLRYILVDPSALHRVANGRAFEMRIDEWLAMYRGKAVQSFDANLVHQQAGWKAHLVRLD